MLYARAAALLIYLQTIQHARQSPGEYARSLPRSFPCSLPCSLPSLPPKAAPRRCNKSSSLCPFFRRHNPQHCLLLSTREERAYLSRPTAQRKVDRHQPRGTPTPEPSCPAVGTPARPGAASLKWREGVGSRPRLLRPLGADPPPRPGSPASRRPTAVLSNKPATSAQAARGQPGGLVSQNRPSPRPSAPFRLVLYYYSCAGLGLWCWGALQSCSPRVGGEGGA